MVLATLEVLHRAGWVIGDFVKVMPGGSIIWRVLGSNGANHLWAEGPTRESAWLAALEQAREIVAVSWRGRRQAEPDAPPISLSPDPPRFEVGSIVAFNSIGRESMPKAFPGATTFRVVGGPICGRYLVGVEGDGRRGIVPEGFLERRAGPDV